MRGHCQSGILDVVMLDMMKRQQNSSDWPYCGPVLITGENKVTCGAEAIVLSEDVNTYVYIMNSMYEMSGVCKSVTKNIFGDGIMSARLLIQLEIEKTCNLILDRYHLLNVDWPAKFGWLWPRVESFMSSLVYAKSEEEYNVGFEEVRSRCNSLDLQAYLENEVHAHRKHFVDFWIKQYPNHLDGVGDQCAEANHSSYCNMISFGSYVHPAEQIVKCMERSKDIAAERNFKRYKYHMNRMNPVSFVGMMTLRMQLLWPNSILKV